MGLVKSDRKQFIFSQKSGISTDNLQNDNSMLAEKLIIGEGSG